MRGFGVLVIVIGVIVILGAMVMDVSVSTGAGRVNNLGLMADRQNYTIIGGVLLIAGLLMTVLGRGNQITQADSAGVATRPCPMCAEPIKLAAIKCKHCGAAVEPVAAPRLRNGWVASIPCKPEDVDRLHEAVRSLSLPLVNMTEGQWGAGPYESKNEARDALAKLHESYRFYGDIVYRDSVSGKYPPIID